MDIFNTLADAMRPQTTPRYIVKTKNRGILEFNELPDDVYYAEGLSKDVEEGTAWLYTWDEGTCLIPIIDTTTGEQVRKPKLNFEKK